jgi:carbonic anhydrase
MDALIEGYKRFRADIWPAERARYEALSLSGQRPQTMIIACSDSRVDPQTVFGAGPGELFVVRNVAALVPPYQPDSLYHGTSAALEFAVRVLKVAHIVVLGHAQCGGVQALLDSAPTASLDFVENWVGIANPVLSTEPAAGADRLSHYEAAVVRLSLANLRTFPWIAAAEARGALDLHGFHFSIYTGALSRLEADALVPVI